MNGVRFMRINHVTKTKKNDEKRDILIYAYFVRSIYKKLINKSIYYFLIINNWHVRRMIFFKEILYYEIKKNMTKNLLIENSFSYKKTINYIFPLIIE